MGQILHCCFHSSTHQPHEEYHEWSYELSERTVSWLSAESGSSAPTPSRPNSISQRRRCQSFELRQQSSQSSPRLDIMNLNATCNPKLECIIVPSFGTNLPNNVVPKKASTDFLKGVGDDFKIIQELISKDQQKELVRVQITSVSF